MATVASLEDRVDGLEILTLFRWIGIFVAGLAVTVIINIIYGAVTAGKLQANVEQLQVVVPKQESTVQQLQTNTAKLESTNQQLAQTILKLETSVKELNSTVGDLRREVDRIKPLIKP